MKTFVFFLTFIFWLSESVLAISKMTEFEDFSYKQGLNTTNANFIFKDSKGFLWICTVDGVFRYDGYSFRNLNSFIKDTFNLESFCMTEVEQGNFLIGTNGKGVFLYNIFEERVYPLRLEYGQNFNVFQILIFKNKVWLASNVGLIMFNYDNFDVAKKINSRIFLPDPSNRNSQNNSINVLMALQDSSSIMVGSNGSLYILNFETLVFEDINSYPQNSIRCFSRYSENMIIVGSWDGGIFGFHTGSKKVQNDPVINEINKYVGSARIIDVSIDKERRIWVATFGNGLYIFEKNKSGEITYNHYKNDQKNEGLKSDFIDRMYIDDLGIAWLCMDQSALSKIYFPHSNIQHIYPGGENDLGEIMSVSPSIEKDKLWVATLNSGIILFNTLTPEFKEQQKRKELRINLSIKNVSSCFQDSKGNLWIVDRHDGLFIVPSWQLQAYFANVGTKKISPIDANDLLSIEEKDPYINQIYEDSRGRIWIGSWGNLYVVDPNLQFAKAKGTSDLISNSVVQTIYSFQGNEKQNFPISPVLSITEINKNQYWIGTSDIGIVQLNESAKGEFTGGLLSLNKQLPGKKIKCLFKDNKGDMWIGTNAGLSSYSFTSGVMVTYTEQDGFASENINNIIEDAESNIWVSTSYGISRITTNNNQVNNYFYPFKENDNRYIPYAAVINSKGILYFSSKDVLSVINPGELENYAKVPPLHFTDIKIDNHKVIPNEKYGRTKVIETNINYCDIINVPYNHTLNIEFAALDYISPEQRIYKYRVGNNKEWIVLNSNQRSLILPAMSPGEYTLEIMLANANNLNLTRSIRINYLPPFWQSKPAFIIYLIILSILFYYYRKLTIQKIQKDSIIEKERYERKKLEELDMVKSEFFSNISHEFRTPLSLIVSPLETLIKVKEMSDKNKEKLAVAMKNTYRLLKLTNELMDFSKIEKKLMLPSYTSCEMVSFINEICQYYTDLAISLNIEFKFNCPLDQIVIPIDARMIEKCVFNLLSNAFKYTMKNGIIMVNMFITQIGKIEYLKISIVNTGEGIPQYMIHKIFDKFFQVDNVQNKKHEGTGIGLALVKSYIELHNGKISVKSEPGEETCFDVYLPLYQKDYKKLDNEVIVNNYQLPKLQVSEPVKNAVKPSSNYTILLVEDDSEISKYITNELSDEFKIITAQNGGEGYKQAKDIIPDLIISDIVMPVLSGIELCKQIKSQVLTSHIPLILLSAKFDIADQIQGLETGADVYIPKPFNIEHLKAQIVRLLNFKEMVYLRYLKENTPIPEKSLNTELDEEFMKKIVAFIEQNMENPNLNVEQLAEFVSLSHAQTYRKVRAISGMSVVQFIRTVRLKKAAQLIAENKLNFTEIAYETGFSSPSYFTRCFHDHYGKSPSDFSTGHIK